MPVPAPQIDATALSDLAVELLESDPNNTGYPATLAYADDGPAGATESIPRTQLELPGTYTVIVSGQNDNDTAQMYALSIATAPAPIGPQLLQIEPNNGPPLSDGDVRGLGPRELVFTLDKNQVIDIATLQDGSGIEILRAGGDGQFSTATGSTEFNTAGAALVHFEAKIPGQIGNSTVIDFVKTDFGGPRLPFVQVRGRTIVVQLNLNAGNESTAQDVVDAINEHTTASQMVAASLIGGTDANPGLVDVTGPVLSKAAVTSDFNTAGAVELAFTSRDFGAVGNDTSLIITKSPHRDSQDRPIGSLPTVSVVGQVIEVDLNTSTVQASVTTGFGVAQPVELVFEAVEAGPVGNALSIEFSQRNFANNNSNPIVTMLDATTIGIEMNSQLGFESTVLSIASEVNNHPVANTLVTADVNDGGDVLVGGAAITYSPLQLSGGGFPSTAQDLMDAINADREAKRLVVASLASGDATTDVTVPLINYSPLELTGGTDFSVALAGADDEIVQPGFVGIGDYPNEVVFRFAEPLPDDHYAINILGQGPTALRNVDGVAFHATALTGNDEGLDHTQFFELELGAQVVAVVPQPIVRVAGVLEQQRDQIEVYFNDDDLLDDATSAENPEFYQLIFTNDTVSNTDDVIFLPTSVDYSAADDKATLTFADDIFHLGGGGAYRLRIGTDAVQPPAPSLHSAGNFAPLVQDPGSTFATAVDVSDIFDTGSVVRLVADGSVVTDGQSVTIEDMQGESRKFEFDNEFFNFVSPALQDLNAIPVSYNDSLSNLIFTPAEIASALVDAINAEQASGFGVTATIDPDDDTVIRLSGDTSLSQAAGNSGIMGGVEIDSLISSVILESSIDPQDFPLRFPGEVSEPGQRDVAVERHLLDDIMFSVLPADMADAMPGTTVQPYNFQENYGFDPLGNPLQNLISGEQKERAREIFSIFSEYAGIQFVETDNLGLTVVTGDLRALDPTIPTGAGGVIGFAHSGMAIMDAAEPWNDGFG